MNEIIENKKKSEILAEMISKLNYGDVILHKDISSIIQEKYPSCKYNTTVQKCKKILLEKYDKAIECVRGDGYRVVKPDDFVFHSLNHYKRGFNEIKKGHNILTHAPVKDMSNDGRDSFRRVYDRSVILQASLKGVSVELKSLAEKNHPFSRGLTNNHH